MKPLTIVILCALGLGLLSIGAFTCNLLSVGADHVTNSVKDAVIDYDQYQDIYNSCLQVDQNISVISETDAADDQFKQGFSKAAQLNALRIRLNSLIEQYNALSAHIDAKWWKSKTLPMTLAASDFPNYSAQGKK